MWHVTQNEPRTSGIISTLPHVFACYLRLYVLLHTCLLQTQCSYWKLWCTRLKYFIIPPYKILSPFRLSLTFMEVKWASTVLYWLWQFLNSSKIGLVGCHMSEYIDLKRLQRGPMFFLFCYIYCHSSTNSLLRVREKLAMAYCNVLIQCFVVYIVSTA